jgi:hypothetical protein
MILSQPLECAGHETFFVEFQEVFMVSYVPELWHYQKIWKRRGEDAPPLIVLNKKRMILMITN